MKILIALFILFFSLTACRHTYYVVRHAEKAVPGNGTTMRTPNDPPLSAAGEQRALALRDVLKGQQIKEIYSTNTIRTKSTAEPLRQGLGLTIQTYGPLPDSAFIGKLKHLTKNVLVVGHSNTVDDIVNGLAGKGRVAGDLPDSEYDNLFVVTYKCFLWRTITYERRRFGAPAH